MVSDSQNIVDTNNLSLTGAHGVIQGAIDWAVAVVADNSHGYSQSVRSIRKNYDCSSLIISAFEAAGVSLNDAGALYTGNMKSAFMKAGFQWIPGDPDISALQPGDILLNENRHTELYIGDGMNVVARGNSDGKNRESLDSEINICNFRSFPWDGVLRYVGYDSSDDTIL